MGVGSSLITALCLAAGASACTIAQMRQDVDAGQQRVDAKQHALADEEARQARLRAELTQLQADLRTRQLSLDELQRGVERLEQRNAAMADDTRQQAARKQQLTEQLRGYQAELRQLRQGGGGMTVEQKRRRLEQLQGEVRKALELLLAS